MKPDFPWGVNQSANGVLGLNVKKWESLNKYVVHPTCQLSLQDQAEIKAATEISVGLGLLGASYGGGSLLPKPL